MLMTHGFLQCCAAIVEKTKCLICCAHSLGLDLSAGQLKRVFFLRSVFIYTEVKYLLTSQKYFHMTLMKLKCRGGKLCFPLVLCQKMCLGEDHNNLQF